MWAAHFLTHDGLRGPHPSIQSWVPKVWTLRQGKGQREELVCRNGHWSGGKVSREPEVRKKGATDS